MPDRGSEVYKDIHKEIKRECRQAKENYLNTKCKDIEDDKRHNSREMYRKVREINKKRSHKWGGTIENKNGRILFEAEEVRERWAEYVEELYNDNDRQDDGEGREINLELPILESEVVTALARMGKNKACGVDQIPTEFLKQMGENGTKC